MKLNVRCCCQPTKILGTLEVPEEHARTEGSYCVRAAYVSIRDLLQLNSDEKIVKPRKPKIRAERIELRQYGGYLHGFELAVYSDDRPVEFWRTIPGFVEGEVAMREHP